MTEVEGLCYNHPQAMLGLKCHEYLYNLYNNPANKHALLTGQIMKFCLEVSLRLLVGMNTFPYDMMSCNKHAECRTFLGNASHHSSWAILVI